MPDASADRVLELHDLGVAGERILAAIESLHADVHTLADRVDDLSAKNRPAVDLLEHIAAVVGDRGFLVGEVYKFAEGAGEAGVDLRAALPGVSPRALGRLLARHARIVVVPDGRPVREGQRWRLVSGFAVQNPQQPERAKLGVW